MERLTHKARYEAGYKPNKDVKDWQVADLLGAYENTGLTPEQIMELKERMNDGWIPVDCKLPKTNGIYNVTRHIGEHFISDSAYFDGQNTWHSDNRVNHSRTYLTDIIAWQPLPEPYRPKKESEDSRRLREREEFFKG